MDGIYLEYSFLHLFTCSCSYSHGHKIVILFGTLRTHLKKTKFHFFLQFSYDLFYISPFILMSNEIILFQILYRHLKYRFFHL